MSDVLADVQAAAERHAAEAPPAPPPAPEAPAPAAEAAAPEAVEAAPEESSEGRARDATGRFTKRDAKPNATPPKPTAPTPKPPAPRPAAAVAAPAEAPAEAPPPEAKAPEARAPSSWRPTARSKWADTPQEVQEEVLRLDKEVRAYMQQTAPARQLAEAFNATIAPYRGLFTDEPLRVVGNLVQTAAQLQTGPIPHKAAIIASLVKGYGVPIEALAAALDGQPAPAGQGQGQPLDEASLTARVRQQVMQELQQRQSQVLAQQSTAAINAFAEGKEYIDDVAPEMAALLEAAARRGVEMSLEEAYTRACYANPEVRGLRAQHEAAEAAKAQVASTQRARAAASSVRSQPVAATPAKQGNGSAYDDVMAAVAAHNGR